MKTPKTMRECFNCPGCGRFDVTFGHEVPPPCGPPVCWWPMTMCIYCSGTGLVCDPQAEKPQDDEGIKCKSCKGLGYYADRINNIALLAKAYNLYHANFKTGWVD